MRVVLEDLVAVARRMREHAGWMPAENSEAMGELAQESRFAGQWGSHPVEAAHAMVGLRIAAAEDHLSAICRLLIMDEPTIYGHVSLARVALEACARAAWLAEPGIGAVRRLARGQTERLYSLSRLKQVAVDPDIHRRRIDEILAEAQRLGIRKLPSRKGTPPELEDRRPGATSTIHNLFGGERSANYGRLIFETWSSIAHSTLYGLTRSLDPTHDPRPLGATGEVRLGQLYVNSGDVNTVLGSSAWAYVLGVEAERTLCGWRDEQWDRTAKNAVDSVRFHFARGRADRTRA